MEGNKYFFLGQDEHLYTYSHPYNIYRSIEARYGGRVGANIREFDLNAITPISKVISSHLNSNGGGVCFLMEIYQKHIVLYKEKHGNEDDKTNGAGKD